MGTSRPQRALRNHIEKHRDLGYSYRWGLLINDVSNLFLEILTEGAVTMEDLLTHTLEEHAFAVGNGSLIKRLLWLTNYDWRKLTVRQTTGS